MRKMMLLAVMAAMAALMLSATPALADDRDGDGWDEDFGFWIFVPVFIEVDVDFDGIDDNFDCDFVFCDDFDEEDDFCDEFFDCKDEDDFCDFFECDFDDSNGFGNFEQEAESGDVDQTFYVSNTGDNSNQSVGIQGVANTGNAQNQIGITQFGNDFNNDDQFCDEFNEFCENLEEFCEDFDGDGFCDEFFDFIDDFDRFDGDGFATGGDFEFEDVGASIEVSPTQTFESDQQINQSAVAFGGKGWWY